MRLMQCYELLQASMALRGSNRVVECGVVYGPKLNIEIRTDDCETLVINHSRTYDRFELGSGDFLKPYYFMRRALGLKGVT
jgi:hypothetical protein